MCTRPLHNTDVLEIGSIVPVPNRRYCVASSGTRQSQSRPDIPFWFSHWSSQAYHKLTGLLAQYRCSNISVELVAQILLLIGRLPYPPRKSLVRAIPRLTQRC